MFRALATCGRSRVRSVVSIGCAFGLVVLASAAFAASTPDDKPELLVVMVVDQLRASSVQAYSGYFGSGGFRRLFKEGAEFRDTSLIYSGSMTAPGHATISTGTYPRTHGIPGNYWVDRAARKQVYCVGAGEGMPVTPANLKAPTLAQMVVEAGGKAIAISQKDRSAILLGGIKPTAAVFINESGRLGSGAGALPKWAVEFNEKKRPFKKWEDKPWTPMVFAFKDGEVVPNDFPIDSPPGFGNQFPHPLPKAEADPAGFWNRFSMTPFSGDALLDIIEEAVASEKLGKDASVDLLAISFSQVDLIGHIFGPDSAEYRDGILRLDGQIERLLTYLDKQVGAGNYTLAFTSDHGVTAVPEVAQRRGLDAGRIHIDELAAAFDSAYAVAAAAEGLPIGGLLRDAAGKRIGLVDQHLTLELSGHDEAQIVRARELAARVLRGLPEIRRAYTREDMLDEKIQKLPYIGRMRLSFHPDLGGDVAFLFRRGWVMMENGTTHGSPETDDTVVPLLFFGAGVRAAAFRTVSTIADVVPTLLAVAELPIPKHLEGRVLPVSPNPAKHFKPEKPAAEALPGEEG